MTQIRSVGDAKRLKDRAIEHFDYGYVTEGDVTRAIRIYNETKTLRQNQIESAEIAIERARAYGAAAVGEMLIGWLEDETLVSLQDDAQKDETNLGYTGRWIDVLLDLLETMDQNRDEEAS